MKRLVQTHAKNLTVEEAEQIGRITVLFNLVALCFLGIFAFIAFKTNDARYGTTLLEVMGLSICNIALFLISGRMRLLVLMTCLGYLPFCAFLQISGGQNNSGILWHYVYPIMVYYIAGLRMGSVYAGTLIVMEIVLMFLDDQPFFKAHYSVEFKFRFLASMIVMSIMGALLEYSRSSAQTKLMVLASRLEKVSQTDDLTGLPNRRALRERLETEAVKMNRSGEDFSLILCDIDHFKFINDNYGHAVGDEALRHLATCFQEIIRRYDLAARWGGEEFLLVLPNTSVTEAEIVAERIRTGIASRLLCSSTGETIRLTISCGVCSWKEFPELDELFKMTDHRLYRAKSGGRNRVVGRGDDEAAGPPESGRTD